jgi:hypothetical protein
MKTQTPLFLFSTFLFLLTTTQGMAQTTYTWTGGSNDDWGTSTNWSPNGVPGSSDHIVIQTGTYYPKLAIDRSVSRYKINSGTMHLNGRTLSVSDKVEILGGTTTAGRIVQSASNIANVNNATVNCKLDLTATTVTFQYATCTDSVKVKQTTTSGTITWRGNKFHGHLDIENTSNGNMNLGYNPADSCFDGLTLRGGRIRVAYAHPGYYVAGNMVVEDSGPSGTSFALAGGDGTAVLTVDGDIVVDKTGNGSLMFAVTSGTCQLTQLNGRSIYEGTTGYTTGYSKIMGLTQQGGGGVSYLAGAGTQEFLFDQGIYGPNIGSLSLDLEDVTLNGAVVNGTANVVAEHLSVLDNRFNAATYLEKTGSGADNNGGNVFQGPVTIVQSGSADMQFAYTDPDTAYSSLQLRTTTAYDLTIGAYDEFVAMGSIYCNQQSGDIILGGTSGGDFIVAGPGVQTLAMEQGGVCDVQTMTFDKPSGYARLTGTMQVSNSLTLTQGVIHTVDSGLVVIVDNATVSGTSDASHVEGPVLKEGNDAFSFPIGRNGIHQPLGMSAPGTTGHAFQAEYFDEDSDPDYSHASREGSIAYLDRTQYWMFERVAGTGGVNVTLGWRDVACGITSISDPDVCAWNGSQWKNLGNAGETGTVVTGTATTDKGTSFYGPFTWGNFSGIWADAGPDRVMEAGDTVTIGVMTQENWAYDWTPSATVVQADTAITRAHPTSKTEYVLEVTGENSCTATDTMVVYITVLPEDTARSSLDFVVNNGQIIDTDGASRPDIGIYSHQASPMVYCADNRVSFVHAKIDTVATTPDTLARVDINFHETYREAEPLGMGLNPHHYNYYYAHCPDGVTLTPSYNRVVYPQLYENTDLHIKGNNNWMKFEFVIHPGGDPEDILMTFDGAENVQVIQQLGMLVVSSSIGTYIFPKPTALKIDTVGAAVELGWQPDWDLSVEGDTVRFVNIGSYNPAEVLIFTLGEEPMAATAPIDNLMWSTFVGGAGLDQFHDVKTNSSNNIWVYGLTTSEDFPAVGGESNTNVNGDYDFTMSRYSFEGIPIWSTYYGGSGWEHLDYGTRMALDEDGNSYMTGYTDSQDYPLSTNTYDNINTCSGFTCTDAIVTVLDSDGLKLWSTYFGTSQGGSKGYDILVNDSDEITIVGSGTVDVVTNGGAYFDGSGSGFISEFSASRDLVWSTQFANASTTIFSALDFADGALLISGLTEGGLPTQSYGTAEYDNSLNGDVDAFLALFDSHDRALIWCTYLGGDGFDNLRDLASSANNEIYAVGETNSANLGTVNVVGSSFYESAYQGDGTNGVWYGDGLIAKFNADLELDYLSYYGGTASETVSSATFANQHVFTTNITLSDDIPFANPNLPNAFVDETIAGGADNKDEGLLMVLDSDVEPVWTSYFGGYSAFNGSGYDLPLSNLVINNRLFIVGATSSSNFPIVPFDGAYNDSGLGGIDGFIMAFDLNGSPLPVEELPESPDGTLLLYPNPASSIVNIKSSIGIEELTLINSVGQRVVVLSSNGGKTVQLDVQDLSSGVYFLNTRLSNQTFSASKLVIH